MRRSRLALRQVLEDRIKQHGDAVASDPITKKMASSFHDFMENTFEADTKKVFRNNGATPELAMARSIARVFGDYNAAARTPMQRFMADNMFNFYGWWRGTFTSIVTAPLRHPVRAVAYPMLVMDQMNQVLGGNHVWDNEPGKRFRVKVDPKKVPWLWSSFGMDPNQAEPAYISPPGSMTRMWNIWGGDNFVDAASMAAHGQARQGATLVLNHLLQAPIKMAGYSSPLPIDLGNFQSIRGYQTNSAARLALDVMSLMAAKQNHQWNQMADIAVKAALSQASFNGAELYDGLQANGPWQAPMLMFATNTVAPFGVMPEKDNAYTNRVMELRKQFEGLQIPTNLMAGMEREQRILSAGKVKGKGVAQQKNEMIQTAIQNHTKDPEEQRQLMSLMARWHK